MTLRQKLEGLLAELRAIDLMEVEPDIIPEIADRLAAALVEDAGGWRPIVEAPQDGTRILAYGPPSALEPDQLECRETRWSLYGEGSQAKALHDRGLGPSGCWEWSEPQGHWLCHWHPTHWMPLPPLPGARP